jgi:hypothetical protein
MRAAFFFHQTRVSRDDRENPHRPASSARAVCLLSWRGGSDVLTAGGTEIEWLRLREEGAKNCDAYGVDGGVDGRGDSERGLPLATGDLAPGKDAARSRSSTSGKSPAEPASRCR